MGDGGIEMYSRATRRPPGVEITADPVKELKTGRGSLLRGPRYHDEAYDAGRAAFSAWVPGQIDKRYTLCTSDFSSGPVCHSLERGAPIHLVQATLGHACVATTSRYLHARPSQSSAEFIVAR